jgi:hypothetical protein
MGVTRGIGQIRRSLTILKRSSYTRPVQTCNIPLPQPKIKRADSPRSHVMYIWLRRCVIALVVAVGLAASLSISLAQSPPSQTVEGATADELAIKPFPVTNSSDAFQRIAECLANNKEAVLFARSVDCVPYREGTNHLEKKADFKVPFDFKSERDCPRKPPINQPFNARHLTSETIEKLAKPDQTIGTHGIRILGAIFCKELALVGLQLPSSLVLDKSVFNDGIEIRNLRTKGDLSVDGSLVFKQLRIIRSNIEGSLFGDKAFIQNLSVSNSKIDSSASLRESILFQSTQFDDATITRELTVRGSILSYFIAQFSHIGGLLDLSHTAARCAYHINKSEIGFLVAKRAGFGTAVPPPAESDNKMPRYDWRHDFRDFREAVKRILSSAEVHKLVSEPDSCQNEFKHTYIAEFSLFDSAIKSSLCLSEFDWLAPYPGPYALKEFFKPEADTHKFLGTVIAIDGNRIGNNFIIDLWSTDRRIQNPIHDKVSKRLHKFEAIGVEAGALVIDFKDSSRNYFIAIDGLKFDRVQNAHATCEYGGSESEVAPILEERKHTIISDFTEQLELPTVGDVLKWLDLNESGSTQPYTAFATAFEAAGLDSTRIKVARANREVCDRAAHWLSPALIGRPCPDAVRRAQTDAKPASSPAQDANDGPASSSSTSGWSELAGEIDRSTAMLSDFSLFMFRAGLWLLADHGYRPGKVLWWVTFALAVFWLIFMVGLRIVAFSTKSKLSSDQTGSDQ